MIYIRKNNTNVLFYRNELIFKIMKKNNLINIFMILLYINVICYIYLIICLNVC